MDVVKDREEDEGRTFDFRLLNRCFHIFQSVLGTVYLSVLDSLAWDSAIVEIHKLMKKTCSF